MSQRLLLMIGLLALLTTGCDRAGSNHCSALSCQTYPLETTNKENKARTLTKQQKGTLTKTEKSENKARTVTKTEKKEGR